MQEGGWKSRKGFGYQVKPSAARPSNTSVWEFLAEERYADAVVKFIKDTRVGEIRAGVVNIRAGHIV